ncbi:MAG TPA: hypothetical protein VNW93_04270 [Mycobacterium sp.]|nr:hypothetical protein [Mycobacterium sp.]
MHTSRVRCWFCHTLTLLGQVGPVGVMAQLAGLPDDQVDTAVSDAVFTAAVQKVRRAT